MKHKASGQEHGDPTIKYTEIKRLNLIIDQDEMTRWRFPSAKKVLTRLPGKIEGSADASWI
jgi:hypothetical protein